VRAKIEDVEVDDPKEAMKKFKSALAQVVRASKIATRRKRTKAKKRRKA
jgi:hypothetical protein